MDPHEKTEVGVAERRRAARTLRESEAKLQRIVDHAPVAIAVMKGYELEYVSVNPAYQAIMGPDVQFIGRTYRDVFPQAADRGAEERLRDVLRTGRPWKVRDFHTEIPGRTGMTWWDGEYLPLPNERGEIDSVLVLTWEITERKEAEEALRESEARYRALVESQAEMLCRFRPDGEILFVNAAYARARDTTQDDLIGASFWDFIPEEDHEAVRAMLDRLTPEAPEIRIENRLNTIDGERWTMWTNRALAFDEQGRLTEAQSTGIDITQRKRAERVLKRRFRQLEAIYRLSAAISRAAEVEEIVEAAMDGLLDAVSADRASVLLFDDDEVARFEGWRGLSGEYRRAVEGHSPWQPEDTDARPIAVPDVLTDESLTEFRQTITNEGIRALSFIPLVSGGGVVGKFMVYYDRPHEFTEQELHVCETIAGHVAYAIERAQAERALRESEERLREADRRKDEFLATLGHELRNPLAPLRNMLQVMRRVELDSELLDQARATMERQVDQMVRLVNDLLDVSRISRGEIKLRNERVDISELIRDTVTDFRASHDSDLHELEVELPPEPLHLEGDPVRLAQVLENLLKNAWKYTERGGRIRLAVQRADLHAVIRVHDTGVGIEPDRLPHIFDMFYHSDETGSGPHEGGLGIGLALVKTLVELHGGSVQVRSEGRGTGSEFVVRLPVSSDSPARGSKARSSDPVRAGPPRRILVVDDNRDAAETLARLLELRGHQVHLAFDGPEAVEAAARIAPDVILLDIGLPTVDGYEAARLIRKQDGGNGVLLLALTGWSQEEDRRRSREAGFDAHLVKPLDLAEFERLLSEARDGGRRPS